MRLAPASTEREPVASSCSWGVEMDAQESIAKGRAARAKRLARARGVDSRTGPARSGRHSRRAGPERVPELVPLRHKRMLDSAFAF